MHDRITASELANRALQCSAFKTNDLAERIEKLELAARYLFCASILNGEISWPDLCRIIHKLEERHKTSLSSQFNNAIAQASNPPKT